MVLNYISFRWYGARNTSILDDAVQEFVYNDKTLPDALVAESKGYINIGW